MLEIGLPGVVFLVLCLWLVRKLWKAARTESDLEANRFEGALADELEAARARARGLPADPPTLAPVAEPDAAQGHLDLVRRLVEEREQQLRAQERVPAEVPRRVELLWIRSAGDHVAWCERRIPAARAAAAMTRDVICVARVERGAVAERWFFG